MLCSAYSIIQQQDSQAITDNLHKTRTNVELFLYKRRNFCQQSAVSNV